MNKDIQHINKSILLQYNIYTITFLTVKSGTNLKSNQYKKFLHQLWYRHSKYLKIAFKKVN